MARVNLTLKQKCQIIELSGDLSTEQLAKKFRVHPTTVTRTIKNKNKILDLASRVNHKWKTVQTIQRGQEHDIMILDFIRSKQIANQPVTINEICDKAVEFAQTLNRIIKSRRGWWRRFKDRCNIVRSRLHHTTVLESPVKQESCPLTSEPVDESSLSQKKESPSPEKKVVKRRAKTKKEKLYTYKIKESKLV